MNNIDKGHSNVNNRMTLITFSMKVRTKIELHLFCPLKESKNALGSCLINYDSAVAQSIYLFYFMPSLPEEIFRSFLQAAPFPSIRSGSEQYPPDVLPLSVCKKDLHSPGSMEPDLSCERQKVHQPPNPPTVLHFRGQHR